MTNTSAINLPAEATVEFKGAQLITIRKDDIEYVAMRPVVEAIGLDWKGQSEKLRKRQNKFSCGDIPTTGKDGKTYNMLCIPITKFNGWAFSINTERIPDPETRKRVELYQEECFLVLYEYWHKGIAERKTGLSETLTPSEQHEPERVQNLSADEKQILVDDLFDQINDMLNEADRLTIVFRNVHLLANRIINTLVLTNPEQYKPVRLRNAAKRCASV